MKKGPIYLVAVLKLNTESDTWEGRFVRDRIWGFFHDLETAQKCVEENWTDIFELNYYNMAVISEMPAGVCTRPSQQWWYHAKYFKGKQEPEVNLIHHSKTLKDFKKDPLNENLKMPGIMGYGWG